MADFFQDLTGDLDRRFPRDGGKPEDAAYRHNLIARDGRLSSVKGTERLNATDTGSLITWLARYTTIESGIVSPKTVCYTNDGNLYRVDIVTGILTQAQSGLNQTAYPRHWQYKLGTQTLLFLVDGLNLWKYDGNDSNIWENVGLKDALGDPVKPIDVIEHKDRLCLLTKNTLMISANLAPTTFDSAVDSIEIVLGSGKGENIAFGKIDDNLFIFSTEGIFVLYGDTISAVASTFEVRLADNSHKAICTRTVINVENAIIFLGEDLELWSFSGSTMSCKLLSYKLKLKELMNHKRDWLDKAVACYYDNFYMLSFVEKGQTTNRMELWYDTFEEKMNLVYDRRVSCYCPVVLDSEQEERQYLQTGRSDVGRIMWCDRGTNFDDVAIEKKLTTKDITPKKGRNVRFSAFYPELEPVGNRQFLLRYIIDGRLSNPSGSQADVMQNEQGDVVSLGFITIANQEQFTDRFRPKIDYARGTSIAFEIYDQTKDLALTVKGIGIDMIDKAKKKGKKVGS